MANIYVRKSGNDSNDGSTPALAKLTIAGAISAMNSGDIIYIGSGIYREFNLLTGAKTVSIIGDTTGELTGDVGEVIWSGMNSDDSAFETTVQYAIYSNNNGYGITVKNIIFENWDFSNSTTNCRLIFKDTSGVFDIEDVKIRNISSVSSTTDKSLTLISFQSSTLSTITLKNIDISGVKMIGFYVSGGNFGCSFQGIYIFNGASGWNISPENIRIHDISISSTGTGAGSTSSASFIGLNIAGSDLSGTSRLKNIDIYNINCCGGNSVSFSGVYLIAYHSSTIANIYNSNINNIILGSYYSSSNCRGFDLPITGASSTVTYNCSVSGVKTTSSVTFTDYYNFTENGSVDKMNYIIPKIEPISRFSPLLNGGNATYPSTDIEGNPRPAYGNTNCNIGASEATNENVQKESTIKDSGDYSIRVSPCNYFKKVFQVPVEASTLRTVKVKIRIDGTWGTYLPRVSLSGQGMTLSQDTKNSTTGSFEELTVSGTPTTTGIALLTIEAHSPNTDAAFYIDTITIE